MKVGSCAMYVVKGEDGHLSLGEDGIYFTEIFAEAELLDKVECGCWLDVLRGTGRGCFTGVRVQIAMLDFVSMGELAQRGVPLA